MFRPFLLCTLFLCALLPGGQRITGQSVAQIQPFEPVFLPFSEEEQRISLDLRDYVSVEGYDGGTLVRMLSNRGMIHIELLDDDAPTTVSNFLNYVRAGRYEESIFHRSIGGFILQGGGFTIREGDFNPQGIPLFSSIPNEFTPENSNLRGTVSMAKQSDNPDSATSQFFFNLSDNSEDLDNQNGGFTVFAKVVGLGMNTVGQISRLTQWNAVGLFGPSFRDLPLIHYNPEEGEIAFSSWVRFLEVSEVAFFSMGEVPGMLEVEVEGVTASSPASVSLEGSQLQLTIPGGETGRMDLSFLFRESGFEEINFLETGFGLTVGGLIADIELNGSWKFSNWFGLYYKRDDNWIYHERLGWLLMDRTDAGGGVFLYTPLGWLWTREDFTPYFWKPGSNGEPGSWLYWEQSTVAPVYFFDFGANGGAGSWVVFE